MPRRELNMNLDEIKEIAKQFFKEKRGDSYKLSDFFVDKDNCAVFYVKPEEEKKLFLIRNWIILIFPMFPF